MFKTRISVSIARTREDIFDYVTDPANDVQWQSSVQSSQWASQPPHGVGSTQNLVNRFLGRKIKSTIEITIWDRPNTFGIKVIKGPVPFQAVIGLVGKQLEKELKTDFNALKLLLEGEQG